MVFVVEDVAVEHPLPGIVVVADDDSRGRVLRDVQHVLPREIGLPHTVAIHIESDPLAPVPSSESWWDVPVSQVSDLDSTQAAFKTYEGHKARQRPYLTPSEGTDR